MEFWNKIKWAFSPFKQTETLEVVEKTVDTVISAFTTVLTDLDEVANSAKQKVEQATQQIAFIKEDAERSIKNLEDHVKTQINESERAKAIIDKIASLLK